MASKVLKANNKERSANKAQPKTKTVINEAGVKAKKMPKFDLDYSTIREAVQKNDDARFVTYYVYDNHSESDVLFCEHKDHLPADVRAALKDAGIKL